jgi:hypothetical protein
VSYGAERTTWDEDVGCWRTPGGSLHEVQRHKKRKLEAETERALCERIDSEVHDAAIAAADAAVAARHWADSAAAAAAAATAAYNENTLDCAARVARRDEHLAAQTDALQAARRVEWRAAKLFELDLHSESWLDVDVLFSRVPCFQCTPSGGDSDRLRHECPQRAWGSELRSALERASTGQYGSGRKLLVWRRAAYWEGVEERLDGSGISRAQYEGILRYVLEEKVRSILEPNVLPAASCDFRCLDPSSAGARGGDGAADAQGRSRW